MNSSKILKAHLENTRQYFIIEVEKRGSVFLATNIAPITTDEAQKLKSEIAPIALQTTDDLPACKICGSRRVAHGHDGDTPLDLEQNKKNKQIIYCRGLVFDAIGDTALTVERVVKQPTYDIYFVMDASGSMDKDLGNAAKAARGLVSELQDMNNNYYFIAFGSTSSFLVKKETDTSKVFKAITVYEKDESGVGYTTDGNVLWEVKEEVMKSKNNCKIIILTDGAWDNEYDAIKARDELLRLRPTTEIIAVGIGSANEKFLTKIRTVDKFTKNIKSDNLVETFKDISKMLSFKK